MKVRKGTQVKPRRYRTYKHQLQHARRIIVEGSHSRITFHWYALPLARGKLCTLFLYAPSMLLVRTEVSRRHAVACKCV